MHNTNYSGKTRQVRNPLGFAGFLSDANFLLFSMKKGGKIMELIMSFEKNDEELIVALQQQFGDEIEYSESKNFDGLEILLTAVVPITALTVQIIDFILANFWDRDKKSDNNDRKRIIVDSDGSIDLKGYNEEEACRIIECYFENQHDKRK